MPLILLAWPITWDHYVILMLPWFVLAIRGNPRLRLFTVVSFVLCVVGVPRVDLPLGYVVTLGLLLAVGLDRGWFRRFSRPAMIHAEADGLAKKHEP